MFRRTRVMWQILLVALYAPAGHASDSDDAVAAAKAVLTSLSNAQYELVWKAQASEFLKRRTSEDDFIASMAIGRANLGNLVTSKLMRVEHSDADSSTGYRGSIYTVTFLNTYARGRFHERIVVVREPDGGFRLSGLWGAPERATPEAGSK